MSWLTTPDLVTPRYKLVYFYEPQFNYWELFDLEKDPRELKSVFGQPDYAQVQKDMEAELTRLRKELKVPAEDPPESMIRGAAAKPKPKAKAKRAGGSD
jgi:hypothetical protein